MANERRRVAFAHMVGLPERLDPLPEPRMHPLKRGENAGPSLGRVQVRFKEDSESGTLQKFLIETTRNTHQILSWFIHLGMKKKDITGKLKYYREAVENPNQAVMLGSCTQRMLAVKDAGKLDSQNLAYRPKPKYRTREPGVKTILAFNLTFILWLMYGSV